MKVRFKQGGGYKYYVVVAVAATLLTVLVNTDYVVANSAITDVAYSFIENPFGYPDWFVWSPTATGFSGSPTTDGSIRITADTAFVHVRVDGTSNATTFTVTNLPVAPNGTLGANALGAMNGTTIDNGVTLTTPGRATINDASTTMTFRSDTSIGAWTAANNKRAQVFIFYKY
jgi:hypothetical protein